MAVKIWDSKKFARINWQNRPSTATALGATNLNKIDVFCNDVDNALIQFDAQKLNIEVANSMLASVQYDQSKGQWTFKSLDGATYTFDQNIEKIPVSFSLSETGVLTMVTEDGTEYTANIADLIKDYVFDDSDTVAFSKEFVEEDDEGKGAYHISASVKDGSIGEKHLNPDYRSDILTYKTQAQEAANESLDYSKDSKRWAVGDSAYEGSETDNSKYYKEQAEAAKAAAEKARDEAQAATGNVIMTPERLGVGKPDNETIGVEEDGTIKLLAKAASLLITDTQGLIGAENQETTTQLLINAIADKVVNQLVTNEALTTKLENYILKSQIVNNLLATQPGNVLDAMQGKILADKFAQLNSEFASGSLSIKTIGTYDNTDSMETDIKKWLKSIPENNICFAKITSASMDLTNGLQGGTYLFMGWRRTNYGMILCLSYWQSTPIMIRIMNEGEFTTPKFYVPFENKIPS